MDQSSPVNTQHLPLHALPAPPLECSMEMESRELLSVWLTDWSRHPKGSCSLCSLESQDWTNNQPGAQSVTELNQEDISPPLSGLQGAPRWLQGGSGVQPRIRLISDGPSSSQTSARPQPGLSLRLYFCRQLCSVHLPHLSPPLSLSLSLSLSPSPEEGEKTY